MLLYLLINMLISGFAWVGLRLLADAPTVLWQLPAASSSAIANESQAVGVTSGNYLTYWQWSWRLFAAMALGGLKFAADVVRLSAWLAKLRTTEFSYVTSETLSDCVDHRVRIVRNSKAAFTSGLARTTIWIGDHWLSSPLLSTILLHEQQHLRQGDNLRLFILHLCGCLCWWNPLVISLKKHAVALMELSCDWRCQALSQRDYRRDLAQLAMLRIQPTAAPIALCASFLPLSSLRFRLQHLKKENRMKQVHGISIALLSLCAAAPVLSVQQADKKVVKHTIEHEEVTSPNPHGIKLGHLMTLMQSGEDGIEQIFVHSSIQDEHIKMQGEPKDLNALKRLFEKRGWAWQEDVRFFYLFPAELNAEQLKQWQAEARESASHLDTQFDVRITFSVDQQAWIEQSQSATFNQWNSVSHAGWTVDYHPSLTPDNKIAVRFDIDGKPQSSEQVSKHTKLELMMIGELNEPMELQLDGQGDSPALSMRFQADIN